MDENQSTDSQDPRRGKMDMTEHEKTWNAFMAGSKVGSLVIGAMVAFLTLWIAGGFSFGGALFLVLALTAFIAFLFR